FPFALVNNNLGLNRLEVMPAYFWMHNLYALERNSWKTQARDKRKIKKQRIEADYLAPDTVEEIIAALAKMEPLMKAKGMAFEDNLEAGSFVPKSTHHLDDKPLPIMGLERHSRESVLLKPQHAREAYREMLRYYSLKTLAEYLEERPDLSYNDFVNQMEQDRGNGRVSEWVNLGGQIVPAFRVDELRKRIGQGEIASWGGIHASYDEMAAAYPLERARHAWEVYRYLASGANPGGKTEHPLKNSDRFKKEMDTLKGILHYVADQVYKTRAKDFDDPFRSMTYRNKEEMELVVGNAESNSFVKLVHGRSKLGEERLETLKKRL
ncbi:MAG: DUF4954 family protein, partial [Treponema sp.]|nr:DUF4954 family protein [Treponema sp.]